MFKLTAPGATSKQTRQPDPLFLCLARCCGLEPSRLTASERGRLNRALKELKEVTVGRGDSVAEAEAAIKARALAYRRAFPGCALTPTALAANWSLCVPDRRPEVEAPPTRAQDDETRRRVEATLRKLAEGKRW